MKITTKAWTSLLARLKDPSEPAPEEDWELGLRVLVAGPIKARVSFGSTLPYLLARGSHFRSRIERLVALDGGRWSNACKPLAIAAYERGTDISWAVPHLESHRFFDNGFVNTDTFVALAADRLQYEDPEAALAVLDGLPGDRWVVPMQSLAVYGRWSRPEVMAPILIRGLGFADPEVVRKAAEGAGRLALTGLWPEGLVEPLALGVCNTERLRISGTPAPYAADALGLAMAPPVRSREAYDALLRVSEGGSARRKWGAYGLTIGLARGQRWDELRALAGGTVDDRVGVAYGLDAYLRRSHVGGDIRLDCLPSPEPEPDRDRARSLLAVLVADESKAVREAAARVL